MNVIKCYWKHEGKLCRTDVDNHVVEPFETYGEVVEFVKNNLSVVMVESGNLPRFAVMAVVNA